jgi:hypothetical protein
MSLINEALKKAQRQRSDEPPGMSSPSDRGDYRSPPKTTQMIVLIAAGAAVLVVFSVVITVYLLNRTPVAATPTLAVAPAAQVPAVAEVTAPSPVIVPPVVVPPPATAEKKPAAEPAASASVSPSPAETVAATPATAPIAIPPVAPAERQPDLQTQLFVDSIRVMGIRSQGGESKVMMNDRVYRVNDIVDRARALKLIKVEPELLTFTDPNGMVYTKSF